MLFHLGRARQVRRHAGLCQFIPYEFVDRFPETGRACSDVVAPHLPLGSDGGSASGCGTTRVYAGRFQASPWPASRRAVVYR